MNNSYIPIGGALLLAFSKNGSRSLPVTPESKLFESSIKKGQEIKDDDFLHAIAWSDGNQYINTEIDGEFRIPMSISEQVGMKDLSRLKTLIALYSKEIRLHQAVRMIPIWSNYMNGKDFFSFLNLIPPSEDSVELFLDIESDYNGTKPLSFSEKRSIINMIKDMRGRDIGLFRMAAQVDSLPVDMGSGKHLAFLPNEITLVHRVA